MTFSFLWNSSHTRIVSSKLFGALYTHTTIRLYQTNFKKSFELFCALRSTIFDVNKTHLFSSKRNPLLWRPLRVSRQKTKTRKKKQYRNNCNANKHMQHSTHIYIYIYIYICYGTLPWTICYTSLLKYCYLNTIQLHGWLLVATRLTADTSRSMQQRREGKLAALERRGF